MIDTDKYEGHTPTPWRLTPEGHMTVICKNHATAALVVDAPLLLEEVKRLREVILDFSMPMWNYLNSQVHPDQEGFTSNAVKSLVKNTPYESLMHLWEDACGYLPDPDCDDTLRNKPVWNREMIE
jgi:hypothetical protein